MIEITKDHTGKMFGIQSISTAVTLNPFCKAHRAVEGSICSHCYAEAMMKMYSALEAKLERNTKELTESVINIEELPDTTGQKIFRFEAFGDLNNEIQLTNYMNIVKKNPNTRFTLWSKQYKLVHDYFAANEVPSNFTMIFSSMMVNKKIDLTFMKELGKFKKGQIKSFTVYDYDYIEANWDKMKLNCGSKCCIGCRLCYDLNEVEEISEVLKADQDRVNKFLKCHDPKEIAKVREILSDLIEL